MKNVVILVFAGLLVFTACKNENPVNDFPETPQSGNLALVINKANAPANVTSVTAKLTRENFDPVYASLDLTGNNGGEVTVEGLREGAWHLLVQAFNENNEILYAGETDVTVVADQVTPVSLTLQYVGGSSVGSVLITVDWGEPNTSGWIDHPENPVIYSTNPNYDNIAVWQPSVIVDDEGYKMWYNALSNNALSVVMYATSLDGVNWEVHPEPVFEKSENGWDSGTMAVTSVLRDGNGFKMYYTSWPTQYGPWYVGLAYSADGINWERHGGGPVFTGNNWCNQITASKVLKKDDLYYMFFEGRTETYYSKIGLATSSDGVTWEMINQPVLTATEAWEGTGVAYPTVIIEEDQFKMIYNSSNPDGPGFGMAFSSNGVNWTKYEGNPVFKTSAAPNVNKLAYGDMVKTGNQYRLYYSGRVGDRFQLRMAYKIFE
ncbi:MAG: hypothetical protein SCALA702_11320 [Melioribacteraceae bacterium]|nr:MAG: hypothetical protein SCALA702_11320 [Melioribacteraceae bacterium]